MAEQRKSLGAEYWRGVSVLHGCLDEDAFFSVFDLSSEFLPGLVACDLRGAWLLVVDEELVSCAVGVESRHGGEVFLEGLAVALFQVFARRYERRSLVVTSNLAFADWGQVFQDERLAGALLDRLTHRCHIFEMKGESYRFRESMKARGTSQKGSKSPSKQDSKQP